MPGATEGDLNYSRDCELPGAWQTGVWHFSESMARQFAGQFVQAGRAGRAPL